MFKQFIVISLAFASFNAKAVTEQEFLAKNKSYTDGLIAFYGKEEKNNKKLQVLAANKLAANSDLKKANNALAVTNQNLVQSQNLLLDLKNKESNKASLESGLKNKKKANNASISNLNSQITNIRSDLQIVKADVSQLRNEKAQIVQRADTQERLVDLARNNVQNLQSDIQRLKEGIRNDRNQIEDFRSEIERLKRRKENTSDKAEKQAIQNQIDNRRNRIEAIRVDINQAQNSIDNKENRLISEKSDFSQAQSKLQALRIQLEGKNNEITLQVRAQDRLENQLSNLTAQKSSFVGKNENIDAELEMLARLPAQIARVEQNIIDQTALQLKQQSVVQSAQGQLTKSSTALDQWQVQLNTEKAAILTAEAEHDLLVQDFLTTATVVPSVLAETPMAIDSLLVTETLATSKDWSMVKGSSTTLGTAICAATTQLLDPSIGLLSELMVVKIMNSDGSYSSPFIMVTHSWLPALVIKGELSTDKNAPLLMPLLQSPVANERALISRYSDAARMVASLKADNRAFIEFTVAEGPGSGVLVPFSLRGSNAMVTTLEARCKN